MTFSLLIQIWQKLDFRNQGSSEIALRQYSPSSLVWCSAAISWATSSVEAVSPWGLSLQDKERVIIEGCLTLGRRGGSGTFYCGILRDMEVVHPKNWCQQWCALHVCILIGNVFVLATVIQRLLLERPVFHLIQHTALHSGQSVPLEDQTSMVRRLREPLPLLYLSRSILRFVASVYEESVM